MRWWMTCVVAVVAWMALACGGSAADATGGPPSEVTVAARADVLGGGAGSELGCGPSVRRHEDLLVVSPSGGEDTAALQCALDLAVAAGRPVTVALTPGEFHTAQLLATGFEGRLRGAGMDRTTLQNVARPLPVAADWLGDIHPSAEYPWPALLSFVGGDYAVSDLTIQIVGEAPMAFYNFYNAPMMMVALVGEAAEATFERVRFLGDDAAGNPNVAGNVYNAIATWETIFFAHPPIPLTLTVRGCEFRRGIGTGLMLDNLAGGTIAVMGNRFVDMAGDAVELMDVDRIDFTFLGNTVEAPAQGVAMFDVCGGPPSLCGMTGSRLLMSGNRVTAPNGFVLLSTFGEGMRCALLGNRTSGDAEAGGHGVWLGPGTSGCLVAGSGTVVDEGIGNRVLGSR